jgi:hypothetical protein
MLRYGALWFTLVLAAVGGKAASGADLNFSTAPGEEIASNGVFDVGETISVDLSATYTALEQAVNYQVDFELSGNVASFAFTPSSPASFGSPGSATCAMATTTLARCFGNVDLLADPNARVSGPITVPLGSIVVFASTGPASLTMRPGPFFTEELVSDPNGMLVGSSLPFTPQGLDPNGNVLDVQTGAPLDSDVDGVFDDGDGSGNPTDNPCTTGSANAPCDDNCRYAANPNQTDVGGIGTGSAPDGIGNKCQCGDVASTGTVDSGDLAMYTNWLGTGGATPGFKVDKCNVGSPAACNTGDLARIRSALGGNTSAIQQVCTAAKP